MHTIAVLAQKGGVGKTTLAVSLAVATARAGKTAVIVDVDPQATASTWGDRRDHAPPHVISAQATRLRTVLEGAEEHGVDFVFIDSPPRAEQAAMAAAKAASVILIPCRPDIYDVETVATTLELIRATGGQPLIVAILNGVPPRGSKQAEATEVLTALGLRVCPTALGYRMAFNGAAMKGQAVQEYDPLGKAALETQEIYAYVCTLVDQLASQVLQS